jgi:ABC-type transporter Mla MlaB component
MKISASNKTQKRKRAATETASPLSAAEALATPEQTMDETAAAARIELVSNCTVKEAVALKQSLCAVVDNAEPVTLDASAVERVDTAILQLLCAFVRARVASNLSVLWQGEESPLFESARLLGLQQLLALPAAGATA